MSYASGQVIRDGDVIGWFEYDGTFDVALPQVFATCEELSEHWREDQPQSCKCYGDPVELNADYGHGITWSARMCFKHKFITHNRVPEQYQDEP